MEQLLTASKIPASSIIFTQKNIHGLTVKNGMSSIFVKGTLHWLLGLA